MPARRSLRIYLDDIPRRRAEKGNFNIISLIGSAFEKRGFEVDLCRNSLEARLQSAADPGYSLFHMDDPFHARALTLRRAYYYPFWRIEKSARRWDFEIAKAPFRPDELDGEAAHRFCRSWRKRLFDIDAPPADVEPMVYVPLQGRLLTRRSFQTASPVDMIRAVIAHDKARGICVGFHPGETYTAEEREAVMTLADETPRMNVTSEPPEHLLSRCAYVATENSAVALAGYFFHRPAVLFAKIDFHHIALKVADKGAQAAIAAAPQARPDYDRYLYWFLKQTAINGGAPDADVQIIEEVQRHGWQL